MSGRVVRGQATPTRTALTGQRPRNWACASIAHLPPVSFRIFTCLYAMAHGGPLLLTADVASLGRSTVRIWMVQFVRAVIGPVRLAYMPFTPPPPGHLAAIRSEFTNRRGIPNVAMACDGVRCTQARSPKRSATTKNDQMTSCLSVRCDMGGCVPQGKRRMN